MFKPFRVTDNFESRVESTYRAPITINSGAIVSVDPTDTSAIANSTGYSSLISGSLMLATISSSSVNRELGICIPNVLPGGIPFIERQLGVANNYLSIPIGLNPAVYRTVKGDVIGTTEFVGYLPGDSGATGAIVTSTTGNFTASCGIFQGRFRLTQSGVDMARATFMGNSTANGVAVGLFEIL